MGRTYIPFYLDKTENKTLYYDYIEKRFFKSPAAKPSSFVSLFSGTVGVVIYSRFKDNVIEMGKDSPLLMFGLSLLLSCLLVLATGWAIMRAFHRNRDKLEFVPVPSDQEMLVYIQSGRKWLKSGVFLSLFMFLVAVSGLWLLYEAPEKGLRFFLNTGAWAILFLLVWSIQPIKRMTIYRRMKKEILQKERKIQ